MSSTDIMWLAAAGQLVLAMSALRGRRWFEVVSLLALGVLMAFFAMDQAAERGELMLALAVTGALGIVAHLIWDWRRKRGGA